MALTRMCPHHGNDSRKLVYQKNFSNNGRNSAPKQEGLIDVKAVELKYCIDWVERDIRKLG